MDANHESTGVSRLRHFVRSAGSITPVRKPVARDGTSLEVAVGTAALSAPAIGEICELCSKPIQEEHRHLYEQRELAILCICRECAILFDRREAGGAHYRLVPDRILALIGFDLDDQLWESFDLPVDLAFFSRTADGDRVVVQYPGALGAVESELDLEPWVELRARNPILETIEPEVEALLVNRVGGAREQWIAPLDLCYALAGLIRMHWKGLGGGDEVWGEVARFSERLRRRAISVDLNGSRTDAPAGTT
jgi:hypothetical protein